MNVSQPTFPRLARPRVLTLLSRHSPTLVTGPPGFGKTTVLQDWAQFEQQRTGVAPTFLTIQRRHDDASALVADLRAGTQSPELIDDVLRGRAGGDDPGHLVVVLDRIDNLTSDAALDVIRSLLSGHVTMLASVRDQRSPAARMLRFEGRAVRIGPEELAFTNDESSELLGRWGVSVTADDVARFVPAGNGWPVGVAVLARHVAAAGRLDDDVMLSTWEEFREYLDDQVISQLDPADVHVLAQAVIEDGVTAPIDLSPRGVSDVLSRIENLALAGFLVPTNVPLSRRRLNQAVRGTVRWRMYADVEFGRAMWGEAIDRRMQTGDWLSALRLAMDFGDDVLLRATLEEAWPSCYTSNAVVEAALERLPMDTRHNSASLLVLEGLIASVRDGDMARMAVAVRMAADLGEPPDVTVRLCIEWTSISVCIVAGRHDEAARHADAVLSLLDSPSDARKIRADVQSAALRAVAFHRLIGGDLAAARKHFESARSAARVIGADVFAAASSAGLALIAALSGRLSDAMDHLDDAAALADRDVHPMAASLVATHLARSLCAFLRGDSAGAVAALTPAAQLQGGAVSLLPFAAYAQGNAHRVQGGVLGVSTLEDIAERVGGGALTAFQQHLISTGRALAHLGAGNAEQAEAIAGGIVPDELHLLCTPSVVGLARLGMGQPAAALDAVRDCLERDVHLARTRSHALLVAALAHWLTDDQDAATTSLERAIALASVEDCVGELVTLVPASRALRDLVSALRTRTEEPVVHAVCDQLDEVGRARRAERGLPPLTPREVEILALLGSDKTLPSIANELTVSINTLKTQLRKIYRKLDVTTRHEAVRLLAMAAARRVEDDTVHLVVG